MLPTIMDLSLLRALGGVVDPKNKNKNSDLIHKMVLFFIKTYEILKKNDFIAGVLLSKDIPSPCIAGRDIYCGAIKNAFLVHPAGKRFGYRLFMC